jgi:hypothetical protein
VMMMVSVLIALCVWSAHMDITGLHGHIIVGITALTLLQLLVLTLTVEVVMMMFVRR